MKTAARVAAFGAAFAGGLALYGLLRMAGIKRRSARYRRSYIYDCVVGEAATDSPATLTVVVLGDSTVSGDACSAPTEALPHQVGTHLHQMLGGSVRVVARGVSGANIRQVAEYQVPALSADAVVMSVGVNDAVGRRSAHQVANDTRTLIDASEAAWPSSAKVLIACPDLRHAPGLP